MGKTIVMSIIIGIIVEPAFAFPESVISRQGAIISALKVGF